MEGNRHKMETILKKTVGEPRFPDRLPLLILASRSPRRRELLSRLTGNFRTVPSSFDETPLMAAGLPPEELVLALSEGKALSVRRRPDTPPDAVVIGGDTVVVSPSGEIFGIPQDRAGAERMLRELSGRIHRVVTGITLAGTAGLSRFSVTTEVAFYPLSPAEIDWYLNTGEPFDKAGAYGIQEKGALLVREIRGDYCNVVGLPLAELARTLSEFCEKFLN